METAWNNLAWIALLSAGNAAFVVGIVNRIHACPLSEDVLRSVKRVHYLLIVAFPAALVWFAGIHGPRLFSGGAWSDLPTVVLAYLAMCGGVAACLPGIALSRWLARPPALQLSNHSYSLDVAERLGFRPVGKSRFPGVLWIPGNESLRLEVTEKHFAHPRVPAAWDGLSILHLTDLHFTGKIDRPYFEYVAAVGQELKPDLIVLTGDLLDRSHLVEWLPDTLGKLTAPLGKFFILGNHDWLLGDTSPTREMLASLGWQDVAGAVTTVNCRQHPLTIAGTEWPWMGTHPQLDEADPEAFKLLLSHTPDNIGWARRNGFDLMLAGHNHGGQVQLPLFGPVYAPSSFGCRYAGGVFWEPPTLLYVCRGVSGQLPLRYRCLPEIAKVVLHPVNSNGANST